MHINNIQLFTNIQFLDGLQKKLHINNQQMFKTFSLMTGWKQLHMNSKQMLTMLQRDA